MTVEDRDDLKATAESIVSDAERLKQIEHRKLEAAESGDDAVELAGEAEQLAEDIEDKAHVESDLASRLSGD